MPSNGKLNVLFIGDVIGRPGRTALEYLLPAVKKEFAVDFTIANGENAAGGFGLTRRIADDLTSLGVDVLTSGNHIWDRREVLGDLDSMTNVLRPANYPPRSPGRGWAVFDAGGGVKICVINVSGRVFMQPIDCPFRTVEAVLASCGSAVILVDIHAEATSEKVAMGWYLDGRVAAVVGTHTHVPSGDERVLPGGTAFITDVGMTGPYDSVIGIEKAAIIDRFLTGIPARFEVAQGDVRLSAVVVSIDPATRRATGITRLCRPLEGARI